MTSSGQLLRRFESIKLYRIQDGKNVLDCRLRHIAIPLEMCTCRKGHQQRKDRQSATSCQNAPQTGQAMRWRANESDEIVLSQCAGSRGRVSDYLYKN